jgi:glycine C-acetyltransferase
MKDFADMPEANIHESAEQFRKYINQFEENKAYPYGFMSGTAVDRKMDVVDYYSKESVEAISFVSSNYLGLSVHQKVKDAVKDAVDHYGAGTCAAPPIGGYTDLHRGLEQKLARLHGKEDAILYTSGYAANIGVFQNLFNKSDLVLVDMFVHASIYDGLKNSTNVKMFKHNDVNYLETVLKREQGKNRNLAIVVDGVFSQDGDLADLPGICWLAEKYGAMVFVDDAHGVGVMGKMGRGTLDYFGVEDKVEIVTGTLSKALGSSGGYAAGDKKVIDYLRLYSRSNTFSASIAPPAVGGASKALDLFEEEPYIIKSLWENTAYIKKRLSDMGFSIGMSESPIVPLMINDDMKAIFTARKLFERGVYVVPATYPAVKLKNSRLRVNVSALHTLEDLEYFCTTLADVDREYDLHLSAY